MGKKIAIYLDGTWNTPEDRTNVYALFEETVGDIAGPDILRPFIPVWKKPFISIRDLFNPESHRQWLKDKYKSLKDSPQIRYYDQGVGTHFMNRVRGGISGRGVSINIQQAYEFLCYCYELGDDIYVFGFSRGAYTARSLVGIVNHIGLLTAEECEDKAKRYQALEYVHDYINAIDQQRLIKEAKQQEKKLPKAIPIPEKPKWLVDEDRPEGLEKPLIKFLGVWDTVGAMGIPDRWKKLFGFIPMKVYQAFPNTEICENVEHAYHAMAIDEHRYDFKVVPWTFKENSTELPEKNKAVEQTWFVGAHANVGGGYKDNYLHEISRLWLQEKANECGLVFHRLLEHGERPLSEPVKDSYDEFAGGLHKLAQGREFRKITAGEDNQPGGVINETMHKTVWQYYETNEHYRPQNIPAREVNKNINDNAEQVSLNE